MADVAAVSTVISKVVDMGANMIMEENSRLNRLQEDIEWLEREMRDMQVYLENAEAKEVTDPNVVNVIKDIRDLVRDVEDILDIYLPQIESYRSSGLFRRMSTCFLPCDGASSEFSREIEKIKRRVEGINTGSPRYSVVNDISGTDDVSITTKLHIDDSIVVGFQQYIEELKSKLKEHHFASIVGMPGLGKTTLAREVFEGMKGDFQCCALVSVSQEPNITSLVQDIANQVGLEKQKQEENLKVNMRSYLQKKSYVVFLDDIWDTKTWDSLKECFPIDSKRASRIIITSRNSDVGRYIGGKNSLYPLDPFDYKKSWELFSRLIDVPSELEKIGEEMVKKCGGVPLAIEVVVGMLKEREMSEFCWNRVLHSIGQDASDKCSRILGLSYRDLPASLRPCFLYFGNFPEKYEFSASQIIRLWMAEKFIPHVGAGEPEELGADHLTKLDARNLIQVVSRGHDGRIKKFGIHGLLHSLCVNIGREVDFLNTVDHLESSSVKRVRRVSVCSHSVVGNESLIHQMSKLRALFYVKFDSETDIRHLNNTLGQLKLLQVLVLGCFSGSHVHIPSQIECLSRLNYLEVQFAFLVVIPWRIQNLKKLQTLDFRSCYKVRLPIVIWKMKQLRHLLLQDYEIDPYLMRLPCQLQVFLPNLQTLVAMECSILEPTWLLKFTNLRKLMLGKVTPEIMDVLCGPTPISEKLESLCCLSPRCVMSRRMCLAKYDSLKKLKIEGAVLRVQQPLELPTSIIKLTLQNTLLREDPMKILKTLPKLKILHLEYVYGFGSKMDCSGTDSFPQLQVLQLYAVFELEVIEGEERIMPRLKEVTIWNCKGLVRIPERLRQLQMRN